MSDFMAINCFKCGVEFGIPPFMHEFLRQSGITFYCPYGHPLIVKQNGNWGDRQREQQEAAKVVPLKIVKDEEDG